MKLLGTDGGFKPKYLQQRQYYTQYLSREKHKKCRATPTPAPLRDDSNHSHQQQHRIENETKAEDDNSSIIDGNACIIQSQLDKLRHQWKLEETPLFNLV